MYKHIIIIVVYLQWWCIYTHTCLNTFACAAIKHLAFFIHVSLPHTHRHTLSMSVSPSQSLSNTLIHTPPVSLIFLYTHPSLSNTLVNTLSLSLSWELYSNIWLCLYKFNSHTRIDTQSPFPSLPRNVFPTISYTHLLSLYHSCIHTQVSLTLL